MRKERIVSNIGDIYLWLTFTKGGVVFIRVVVKTELSTRICTMWQGSTTAIFSPSVGVTDGGLEKNKYYFERGIAQKKHANVRVLSPDRTMEISQAFNSGLVLLALSVQGPSKCLLCSLVLSVHGSGFNCLSLAPAFRPHACSVCPRTLDCLRVLYL